jgi:tetratricopeptide (TPR) repeat protein
MRDVGTGWQISADALFESLRPVSFALAALLSACVLADAWRRGFSIYTIALWTLATLFLPHIALPLYLAALILFPKQVKQADATRKIRTRRARPIILRIAAPTLYLLGVLTLGAFYFYLDSRSVDGLLARANEAKLMGQRDETMRALRAALAGGDDPHTRKLLGVELAAAGRYDEALGELQAAASGGEPDDKIHYHIAATLDALHRPTEAIVSYWRFLQTNLCAQKLPVAECLIADARLRAAQSPAVR